MLSPSAEPWLSRATDSAFGVKAGVSPEENMKEAALGAGTLEGTMGAGKGGGNGAWEVLEAGAEDGSRVPSEELQIADPGLGQKKSRLDCSFCAREMTDEQRAGTPYPTQPAGPGALQGQGQRQVFGRNMFPAAEGNALEGKDSQAPAKCSRAQVRREDADK